MFSNGKPEQGNFNLMRQEGKESLLVEDEEDPLDAFMDGI
jgi:hypothetical protein